MECNDTVLSSLHDECRRAGLFGQRVHGSDEVVIIGEHSGFTVVNDDEVNSAHHLQKRRFGDGDPQIHGIQHREALGFGLVNDTALKVGVQVGTEQDRWFSEPLRYGGLKVFEDVQMGCTGLCFSHGATVGALPTERLAGCHLQALQVEPSRSEQRSVTGREIFPHHAHQPRGTGTVKRLNDSAGKPPVGGRATEGSVNGTGR